MSMTLTIARAVLARLLNEAQHPTSANAGDAKKLQWRSPHRSGFEAWKRQARIKIVLLKLDVARSRAVASGVVELVGTQIQRGDLGVRKLLHEQLRDSPKQPNSRSRRISSRAPRRTSRKRSEGGGRAGRGAVPDR